MNELHLSFPALPSSVNKLYFTKGRRRILTDLGRKYKNQFKLSRGGLSVQELMEATWLEPNVPMELELWFFLAKETLYNLTFGQNKRVKSPFADIDTSNMIKLAEDCIAELLGIRDRNNFTVLAHKRLTPLPPKEFLYAIYRPLDLSKDPYALEAQDAKD